MMLMDADERARPEVIPERMQSGLKDRAKPVAGELRKEAEW
jgi:hypothetical protein